ncbi:gasdermin-D isoform X4 [Zalophus californianus]|uniref:Gasdermin-D isoform X4 n=1 Tax=Zalophus californianus TaxID=9704 RepID=A0A6J2ERB1_ZALCA|nr:gasdermin-D isoform X4 [Zalophus californianus]
MASAFESVIKSVVRELDHSGELIPVDSLRSSTSFQPYYLLGRRCSRSWFWKPRYKSINLSIRDILEPDAPEPAVKQSAPIHIYDSMDGELQASGELEAPARGRCAGGAAIFDTFSLSMKVRTLRVDPNIWDAMKQERHLRQPEHKVLQQLRNCGNDVFVVTEVLQTQKEVKVTQTRPRPGPPEPEEDSHHPLRQHPCLPDVLLFPDKTHKKQRTFRLPKEGHQLTSGAGSQSPLSGRFKLESDGFVEDWSAVTGDFRGLQAEVRAQAQVLQGLSKELCERLLAGLVQVLREEPALRTLEDALERGLCCGSVARLDGPVDAVLECLVHTSGELEVHLAGPILYLVEALAVLSESQRELLVEMLETGGLSGQFKLQVGSVLEQSTPWQERRDVSLLQELLGSSWDPEAPAWVLLEECGLGVQVDVPQVCWEPQAQGRTCALYACLALLFGLSQDCC